MESKTRRVAWLTALSSLSGPAFGQIASVKSSAGANTAPLASAERVNDSTFASQVYQYFGKQAYFNSAAGNYQLSTGEGRPIFIAGGQRRGLPVAKAASGLGR